MGGRWMAEGEGVMVRFETSPLPEISKIVARGEGKTN